MIGRIWLIHALQESMAPARAAFAREWPEAEVADLLDDSLSRDRTAAAALTPALSARIAALARYAIDAGATAILFSCSAFGEAIEAARAQALIPILKPNEAMFEQALAAGARMALLATFKMSVSSLEAEFLEFARKRGQSTILDARWVPGALDALQSGKPEEHDRLIAQAAAELRGCDAIMLGQFSMAPAQPRVQAAVGCPVLTSPGSAVVKLKSLLAPADGRGQEKA